MSEGSCSNFGRTENIVALLYLKKKNKKQTQILIYCGHLLLEKQVQNTTRE